MPSRHSTCWRWRSRSSLAATAAACAISSERGPASALARLALAASMAARCSSSWRAIVVVSSCTRSCPAATCCPSSTRTRTTRPPVSDPTSTVRASSVPERTISFGWRWARHHTSVATTSVASTSTRATRGSSFLASGTSTSNGSVGPEVDEGVDVVVQRIRLRRDVEDVVKEDVRLQRAHEEEGGGARFFHMQDAGLGGAAEVVGDDAEAAARRGVVVADVEGENDRRLRAAVHVDGEVLGDRAGDEGDELLGQAAKHDARILGAAGGLETDDARRQLDVPRAHG